MSNVFDNHMQGLENDKVSLGAEIERLKRVYKHLNGELEAEITGNLIELSTVRSGFVQKVDNVSNVKALVAQKRNNEMIYTIQKEFTKMEREIAKVLESIKRLENVLTILNHQDTFKVFDFYYTDTNFVKNNSTIKLVAVVNDLKAQVVYHDVFSNGNLEVRTSFDNMFSDKVSKESIVSKFNIRGFSEFIDNKHFTIKHLLFHIEVVINSGNSKDNEAENARIQVEKEKEILETLTEEEYISLFTAIYVDSQNYLKLKD